LRAIFDAWRRMTRAEASAAFLFGCAYYLFNVVTNFSVIRDARSPTMLLIGDFVGLQLNAFALLLCVLVADQVTGRDPRRRTVYALAVVASAALTIPITSIVWATMMVFEETRHLYLATTLYGFAAWLIIGGVATFVYIERRRTRVAQARMHAAAIDRAHTAKRMLEARLQAMQARVEPQFLFNTLARVRLLYRSDAVLAERMLGELIAYLRSAMPKVRDTSSTLAQELELARAYLAIVRVSLGDRFSFDIEEPADIADARMPPMMLLPLIDHAIVHGLEPSSTPGSIRIRAEASKGRLQLGIFDSGARFARETPGDDALASIRERLAALYGDDASLALREVSNGTEALLELPYENTKRE
jgi:sensor histidine kinase YesM